MRREVCLGAPPGRRFDRLQWRGAFSAPRLPDEEWAMRATVMHAAGDVRVEDVPDPKIEEPTDAVLRVTRACICGSDLWPYKSLDPADGARIMGHEALGVVEDVGPD